MDSGRSICPLHIRWAESKQDIGEEKQDIQEGKQDIWERKDDISLPDNVSKKTKQHIQVLLEEYGYDRVFGRTDVMKMLSITASPASALIKKMLEMELIYPVKGKGKGKYLFAISG